MNGFHPEDARVHADGGPTESAQQFGAAADARADVQRHAVRSCGRRQLTGQDRAASRIPPVLLLESRQLAELGVIHVCPHRSVACDRSTHGRMHINQ